MWQLISPRRTSDGQYALRGGCFGSVGGFLVDISNPRDPTEPTATDQYRTDDGANEEVNDDPIFDLGEAPMAWGADYNEARDLVVTSDFFTGVYTFEVTPSGSASRGSRR